MRGECIKFISLSFSLVSFQKLYFELFIARIMRYFLILDFQFTDLVIQRL